VKVAISSAGKDLTSPIDPRFGRCAYFVIVDTETMEAQGYENPGALAGTGAGVAAAQLVANGGAEAVISKVLGPYSFAALREGDITAYTGASGTVKDAVEQFNNGELEVLADANAEADAGSKRRG
jgi:predicted Fe-Mo cluster-binding NifX family protein